MDDKTKKKYSINVCRLHNHHYRFVRFECGPVISGTIFFYLGKKIFTIADAEDDYSEVHGEELHGQSLDTVNVKINNNDTSH